MNKKVLVTGSAGFIGFHIVQYMLNNNLKVAGVDNITNYYDINLKRQRNNILLKNKNFIFYEYSINDFKYLSEIFQNFKPNIIIHLAAQPGVRYSFVNPKCYIETNINGTFNILELSKAYKIDHLLISSTSSVYGNSENIPFKEGNPTDFPLSFYASTKKSIEILSHSYSHAYNIPITIFRFFTVYGPWGRPDMAIFKFTKSILDNKEIEIFNHGDMKRDFTYIDDLVRAIWLLHNKIPTKFNSSSNDASYRIVNIGNSSAIDLLSFIEILEKCIGKTAKKKFVDHQLGDVKKTWSDISLLKNLTGFQPEIKPEVGIKRFVDWYRSYYDK